MSEIEGAAKRTLTELIAGNRVTLDSEEQIAIASLICLVTMRAEFLDGKLAISDGDREYLRVNGAPPETWRIYCAKFSGVNAAEYWYNRSAIEVSTSSVRVIEPDRVPLYNTQASTFVWGGFLCAAISSSVPAFLSPDVKVYDGQLVRLWPTENNIIDSGLLPRVNDSGAASLGEALAKLFGAPA